MPCAQHLLPVGMTCSRVYWSTINPRRRTVYTVRTVSAGPPAAADLHCVVDHCGSHAEVRLALSTFNSPAETVRGADSCEPFFLKFAAPWYILTCNETLNFFSFSFLPIFLTNSVFLRFTRLYNFGRALNYFPYTVVKGQKVVQM